MVVIEARAGSILVCWLVIVSVTNFVILWRTAIFRVSGLGFGGVVMPNVGMGHGGAVVGERLGIFGVFVVSVFVLVVWLKPG